MEYIDLFGGWQDETNLDIFAKRLFDVLEVSSFEERQSGHYSGGRYFRGYREQMTLTISESDELGFGDLPFWIHIQSQTLGNEELVYAIREAVHKRVIPGGFRVARIENFGKRNQSRIEY